jgi:hypothetical protein
MARIAWELNFTDILASCQPLRGSHWKISYRENSPSPSRGGAGWGWAWLVNPIPLLTSPLKGEEMKQKLRPRPFDLRAKLAPLNLEP